MKLRAHNASLPLLALALAVGCQASSPTGIRVDIDMTPAYLGAVKTLRLTIGIAGEKFQGDAPTMLRQGVAISYPTATSLQMDLTDAPTHPLTQKMSFRLDTANTTTVTFNAQLVGFDGVGNKIASRSSSNNTLPAGGETALSLTLMPDSDGTTMDPTMIDLAKAIVDRKVLAPARDVAMMTVAICDVDGDHGGDLVIGVPAGGGNGVPSTGAVYVVFDGAGDVDLANPAAGQEIHFFGINSGDRLGASIACINFDGDAADDLVVAAPGAYGSAGPGDMGAGSVYVIKGGPGLRTAPVDLLARHEASIEWIGAPGASLGEHVLAAKMQQDHPAILIAAPGEGSGMVHLTTLDSFAGTTGTPIVLSGTAGHVTFSGVKAEAMAVGDLDGNGMLEGGSDVVFGDVDFKSADAPPKTVGAVYVFRNVSPLGSMAFAIGGPGALGPARTIIGSTDNQAFGAAVLAAELTGADGPDLIVGAPGDGDKRGAALIYEHQADFFAGSPVAGPATIKWTLTGGAVGERFGATLASGRLGVADGARLYVGAPDTPSGAKAAAGAVHSFDRHPTAHLIPSFVQRFFGATNGERLGTAIAVGPIGGADALADLVMLGPGLAAATTSSLPGVAYVVLTRPSR